MAFWPSDERIKRPVTATRKQQKVLEKDHHRNYPNIEPGLIGAATLVEDNHNSFKWDFLTTPSKVDEGTARNFLLFLYIDIILGYVGQSSRRLKFGKQSNLFPATKTITPHSSSRSIQQRAEQGVCSLLHLLVISHRSWRSGELSSNISSRCRDCIRPYS